MIPSYMRCGASEPSEPHDTRCDTGNGDGADTNRDVNVDFYRYFNKKFYRTKDKGKIVFLESKFSFLPFPLSQNLHYFMSY